MNTPTTHKGEKPATKTEKKKAPKEFGNLDEVRMQLIVNSMKIKIEQHRLMSAVIPGATPLETAVATNVDRFEQLMQYATIAVTVFKAAKKTVGFFRSFKKS